MNHRTRMDVIALAYLFVALVLGMNVTRALQTETPILGELFTPTQVRMHANKTLYVSDAPAVLSVLESWQFAPGWTPDWKTNAPIVPRAIQQLQIETDGTREGRIYVLVFVDKEDPRIVYPAIWTYERMFGDHTDPDLHNHPDVGWLSMDAAWLDALIAALEGS